MSVKAQDTPYVYIAFDKLKILYRPNIFIHTNKTLDDRINTINNIM